MGNMGKIKNFLILAKDKILDTLFPKNIKCIFCGHDVPNFNEKPYCDKCEKFALNNKYKCLKCATPFENDLKLCKYCANDKKHIYFDKIVCPFIYTDTVLRGIRKFKEENGRYLVSTFAKYIAKEVCEANMEFDFIVPVPMFKKDQKIRGYNQSEILANELAKIFDKPVENELLQKIKRTKHQKWLTKKERKRNLENSMIITNKNFVNKKNFLIVDDIVTTCATIDHCAKLLKKSGASKVYGCAVARTALK